MISFREYIAEETTDNRAHFTSLKNLFSILKDGELKGKHYNWNKGSINKTGNTQIASNKDLNDKRLELCLIRKGRASDIGKIALEAPEVKIIFDWDNIRKLRGIRKPYPIAEAVIQLKDAMNRQVDELIEKKLLKPTDKERIIKKLLNPGSANEYQLQDELWTEYPSLKNHRLLPITQNATNRLYIICVREGEERVDLTKNNIPVSSKYMKIILPKNITRLSSLSSGISDKQKQEEEVQKLISLIEQYKKKDPDLFEFKEKI